MKRSKPIPINRFIVSHLQSQIIGCVETAASIHKAEQAFACRDIESLVQAGAMLHRLPVAGFSGAREYYLALAKVCSGDQARAMFESVVERGSDFYRSRALSALGNNEFRAGRIGEAKRFYLEAGRVEAGDWLSVYYAQHNLAVVESLDGDHRQALNRLESIGPMMQEVGRIFPAHYYDYLHGLSVEYHYAGNQRAAQECLTHALASPYAAVYPEWRRTQGYIASRSTIYIPTSRDRIASQKTTARLAFMDEFTRRRERKASPSSAQIKHFQLVRAIEDAPLNEDETEALKAVFTDIITEHPTKAVLEEALRAWREVLRKGKDEPDYR